MHIPAPSMSSAMNSPEPRSPSPAASLAEAEGTPKNKEEDHYDHEPIPEGDNQMEYSSD
jgi:hypothetical protein